MEKVCISMRLPGVEGPASSHYSRLRNINYKDQYILDLDS